MRYWTLKNSTIQPRTKHLKFPKMDKFYDRVRLLCKVWLQTKTLNKLQSYEFGRACGLFWADVEEETRILLPLQSAFKLLQILQSTRNRTMPIAKQLNSYFHKGFWQPMDTLRDRQKLEQLWSSGNPPWKLWWPKWIDFLFGKVKKFLLLVIQDSKEVG